MDSGSAFDRLPLSELPSYAFAVAECPSCGKQNPDDARFCNACGAELAATAVREVRKTVTVLFADVTGSTALGERLDPESFRRVMARYFEAARTCLERHGGTVEKFIGDAVGPSSASRACTRTTRCAPCALPQSSTTRSHPSTTSSSATTASRWSCAPAFNTGEVVTGTEERLATGDAVNVAARLEEAAEPGEILIGEQTRRVARGAIEVERVEALSLKGKAEPLASYRLVRVVEGASAFEHRFDAPLVGRLEELAKLRAAFDAAVSERRCRLVTVLGPPGIGKSQLTRRSSATAAPDAPMASAESQRGLSEMP